MKNATLLERIAGFFKRNSWNKQVDVQWTDTTVNNPSDTIQVNPTILLEGISQIKAEIQQLDEALEDLNESPNT